MVSSNRSVGEIFPITTSVIPNVPQIAWQLQLGGMKASVELEGQKESPGGRFLGVSLTEIFSCPVKGGAGTLGSHRYQTSLLRHSCLEKSWRKKPQKPKQTKPNNLLQNRIGFKILARDAGNFVFFFHQQLMLCRDPLESHCTDPRERCLLQPRQEMML